MNKINCDVIRDLLPSYVDSMCSAASRRLVEDHIAGCAECRQAAALCRDHELSGEKLELQSLDGLRKVKRRLWLQHLASNCTLFLVIPLGIWIFDLRQNPPSASIQFMLYLLCLFLNLTSGIAHPGEKPPKKPQYLLGAASLIIDVLIFLTILFCTRQMQNGAESFLGMELFAVGPVITRWTGIGFLLQTAFFLWHFVCAVREKIDCHWLLCLSVMGIFFMLNCDSYLYRMASYDTFVNYVLSETLIIAGIGLLSIFISFITARYLRRKL